MNKHQFKLIVFLLNVFLFLVSCSSTNTAPIIYHKAVNQTPVNQKETHAKHVEINNQIRSVKLKLLPHKKSIQGVMAIRQANHVATQQPDFSDFLDAAMYFNYAPDALYQIYCEPLHVTDIALQPGENILSVAAGDTKRWQVSKTKSGFKNRMQAHLLLKPIDVQLHNTMIVTTDKHIYHLLLVSSHEAYTAVVKWHYPRLAKSGENRHDGLSSVGLMVPADDLDFHYQIKVTHGEKPAWMPVQVFHDDHRTYIQFPKYIQHAPSLFVGAGSKARLVNYRIKQKFYIVDSVIYHAQLKEGANNPTVVSIDYNGDDR